MADNLKGIPFSSSDEGRDIPGLVKQIVFDQALTLGVRNDHPTFSIDEVYVVWFSYTLGFWKALCSTSLPDGRYYEVTFDREKSVAYVDTYRKTHNIEVEVLIGDRD
jgi:hypothetical protein